MFTTEKIYRLLLQTVIAGRIIESQKGMGYKEF